MPINESVRGAQHPTTLSSRHLHAQILDYLGRDQEALNEVEELLPIMERIRSATHPETLKVVSLKEEILDKLKGQDLGG